MGGMSGMLSPKAASRVVEDCSRGWRSRPTHGHVACPQPTKRGWSTDEAEAVTVRIFSGNAGVGNETVGGEAASGQLHGRATSVASFGHRGFIVYPADVPQFLDVDIVEPVIARWRRRRNLHRL